MLTVTWVPGAPYNLLRGSQSRRVLYRSKSPTQEHPSQYDAKMASTEIPPPEKSGLPKIPTKQKAAVRQGRGETATAPLTEIDVPTPGPGEILVKINW